MLQGNNAYYAICEINHRIEILAEENSRLKSGMEKIRVILAANCGAGKETDCFNKLFSASCRISSPEGADESPPPVAPSTKSTIGVTIEVPDVVWSEDIPKEQAIFIVKEFLSRTNDHLHRCMFLRCFFSAILDAAPFQHWSNHAHDDSNHQAFSGGHC